ncbi:hypothetical protein PLICRDRAFT_123948 [Plicaturopsis crispa FD-325 SS-3]|nr:hypothetical protein PLICRDRAFT_123948 [Plicaturopsis crispa FD-325 SS-3]
MVCTIYFRALRNASSNGLSLVDGYVFAEDNTRLRNALFKTANPVSPLSSRPIAVAPRITFLASNRSRFHQYSPDTSLQHTIASLAISLARTRRPNTRAKPCAVAVSRTAAIHNGSGISGYNSEVWVRTVSTPRRPLPPQFRGLRTVDPARQYSPRPNSCKYDAHSSSGPCPPRPPARRKYILWDDSTSARPEGGSNRYANILYHVLTEIRETPRVETRDTYFVRASCAENPEKVSRGWAV